MKRKQMILIITLLFLFLPALFHGLILESRAETLPTPERAPVEQLVFVCHVTDGDAGSLMIQPARLEEDCLDAAAFYRPDDSALPRQYDLSPDAQICLAPTESFLPENLQSPKNFYLVYHSLIDSGAAPIFLMTLQEGRIVRLEYAPFVPEKSPLPSVS